MACCRYEVIAVLQTDLICKQIFYFGLINLSSTLGSVYQMSLSLSLVHEIIYILFQEQQSYFNLISSKLFLLVFTFGDQNFRKILDHSWFLKMILNASLNKCILHFSKVKIKLT